MPLESLHIRPTKRAAVTLLEAAGLPVSDLTDAHMEHFFYCGSLQSPTGLVGLEFCGEDVLLRSLVVAPSRRSAGLGATLLRQAEVHARTLGVRAIYLLTTTAGPFFRRHGYIATERASAPAAIRATREFSDICPASSELLCKEF